MDGYDLTLREGTDFGVRRGHWLPRTLGLEYIAVRRTLYCRQANAGIPKHEYLHLAQFRKHGMTGVFWHYLRHGVANLVRYRDLGTAFSEIPFEREARVFEKEPDRT
jgi:hypothetical protein